MGEFIGAVVLASGIWPTFWMSEDGTVEFIWPDDSGRVNRDAESGMERPSPKESVVDVMAITRQMINGF
jgi:hypothetical protein